MYWKNDFYPSGLWSWNASFDRDENDFCQLNAILDHQNMYFEETFTFPFLLIVPTLSLLRPPLSKNRYLING